MSSALLPISADRSLAGNFLLLFSFKPRKTEANTPSSMAVGLPFALVNNSIVRTGTYRSAKMACGGEACGFHLSQKCVECVRAIWTNVHRSTLSREYSQRSREYSNGSSLFFQVCVRERSKAKECSRCLVCQRKGEVSDRASLVRNTLTS